MKNYQYQIIQEQIKDTSDVKKGKDIFYKCTKCGEIIPCIPNDNIGCKCGNVFIDIDYFRLHIENYNYFKVLRRLNK